VGAWVLRQALADFTAWQRAGLSLERVAVNISARQLFDREFVDVALDAMKHAGLAGRRLEVELTEASLIEDFRAANGALRELGRHGIRIALDDFGTGYSSLAYLNELVFDVLKIDRAFVVNLPAPKAVAIVKAIVAVAAALEKEVVAEGIESHQQCAQLMSLGCQLGQGYRLCKPLMASEVVGWSETLAARYALADTAELRRVGAVG
jgi:EAL domain-containing protein (putative c-di-GMP-specific phosphodiesterase class I)